MDYEALNKAIKQAKQISNAIAKLFKELPKIIERLENNIRTMDSDKFEEYLNKLDDEHLKEKAITIRQGKKVKWF